MEDGYYHYTLRTLLIYVYLVANSINQIEMRKCTFFFFALVRLSPLGVETNSVEYKDSLQLSQDVLIDPRHKNKKSAEHDVYCTFKSMQVIK